MSDESTVCTLFAVDDNTVPPYCVIRATDVGKWRMDWDGRIINFAVVFGRRVNECDIGRRIYERGGVFWPETDIEWSNRLNPSIDWDIVYRRGGHNGAIGDPSITKLGGTPLMGATKPAVAPVLELVAPANASNEAVKAAQARVVSAAGPGGYSYPIQDHYTHTEIRDLFTDRAAAFAQGWLNHNVELQTFRHQLTEENLVYRMARALHILLDGAHEAMLFDEGDLSDLP